MIIGVFGSLVIGVLILFFAQKIKENRYKIIIRILGFLFLALPIIIGLWNNYAPKIFNKSASNVEIQNNALESSIPSVVEIAGWQTYRNDQYGFEIKYPSELDVLKRLYGYEYGYIIEPGTPQGIQLFPDTPNNPRYDFSADKLVSKTMQGPWIVDVCEAKLMDIQNVVASSSVKNIGEVEFTRNEYRYSDPDDNSRIIDYIGRYGDICYRSSFGAQTGSRKENFILFDKIMSTFKLTTSSELSGYELIKIPSQYGFGTKEKDIYEFNADLNNDGKKELIRFYWDTGGQNDICEKTKPIVMKIFSGNNTSNEIFSFTYGNDNLIGKAEIFQNFWGDGSNAVMGEGISYGCGSGYGLNIIFFTYRQGQYRAITGPAISGTGGSSAMYKFAGENEPGKKIITAEAYWGPNSIDYCAGCEHKLQFSIYTWNGQEYTKTLAGITQNKYLSETIDQVLQKELSVLNQ